MCMSRIARSNGSPASSQRSASRGDSVARAGHAPLAGLQRRARAGWSRCRRRPARACPASSGCTPTKSRCSRRGNSAIGTSMVNRNVDPLPGPSLSAHMRAAHQLGEALADREAQARAAVLARRRRVGLRERLEQPAHAFRATGRCRCRARRTSARPCPLAARLRRHRQHDLAVLGELHRVGRAG